MLSLPPPRAPGVALGDHSKFWMILRSASKISSLLDLRCGNVSHLGHRTDTLLPKRIPRLWCQINARSTNNKLWVNSMTYAYLICFPSWLLDRVKDYKVEHCIFHNRHILFISRVWYSTVFCFENLGFDNMTSVIFSPSWLRSFWKTMWIPSFNFHLDRVEKMAKLNIIFFMRRNFSFLKCFFLCVCVLMSVIILTYVFKLSLVAPFMKNLVRQYDKRYLFPALHPSNLVKALKNFALSALTLIIWGQEGKVE